MQGIFAANACFTGLSYTAVPVFARIGTMSTFHITSAYKQVDFLSGQPHQSARSFEELDALQAQVMKLQRDLKQPRTREQRLLVKREIFEALRQLDHAAPRIFQSCKLPHRTTTSAPKGYGEMAALITDVELLEARALHASDPVEKANHAEAAKAALEQLEQALIECRQLLQPKRPRLKPEREFALADVNLHLYEPFARAMAESAARDRANRLGAKNLAQLPNIDHVAKEVQAFVAMLDFSQAVDGVIKKCQADPRGPHDYWHKHKAELKLELAHAAAAFTRTVTPLHLTVTASDPTLRTSRYYAEFIDAEQRVEHADTFGSIKVAQGKLKGLAMEFILGGAEKAMVDGKKEVTPHHKLFTRIKAAYRADKQLIREKEREYERRHDTDRNPYDSPLTRHDAHTLNRVYEARWALADDVLTHILHKNLRTVADPNLVPDSEKPPSTHVSEVTRIRKPRVPKNPGKTEKPVGPQGHAASLEDRGSSEVGSTQGRLF